MHPIDFLLRLLSNRITLEQDEYTRVHATLTEDFNNADNYFVRIIKSPYAIIALPILLPICEALLTRLLNWISPPPPEDDGEDFFVGLQNLIDQHRGGGASQ